MKLRPIYILLALSIIVLNSCYKEEVNYNLHPDNALGMAAILQFNGKDCVYDYNRNILRYPISSDSIVDFSPYVEFQNYSEVFFNGISLSRNCINNLGTVQLNREYTITINTGAVTKQTNLIFTNLPVVHIVTINRFYDEPKALARITVNYPEADKPSFSSYIGIEYRGVTAQLFDKKSYGFVLLGSMNIKDEAEEAIFDMRSSADWILDAMYIDCARLRNKISFEIWRSMGENCRHDGLQSEFVELIINNEHKGLYCFNENITPELLQLNKPDAVLYKAIEWAEGAVTFNTSPGEFTLSEYWEGWEQKYPDADIRLNWIPLNDLRNFIVNSSDAEFCEEIGEYIDINNFIDYYLFLNLVTALDNIGKNTFLARTDNNSPFFIIPWDIDASWGLFWNGSHIGYTNVLTNNLYDRLLALNPDNFRGKVKSRWVALRSSSFGNTEILSLFNSNFTKLSKSDIIPLENSIWTTTINIEEEHSFLLSWIPARLEYLDAYFNEL